MSKEELTPSDLGHLEDKAQAIKHYLAAHNDAARSPEYRAFMLEKAKMLADTLVADFGYYFDNYKIGGIEPYALSSRGQS